MRPVLSRELRRGLGSLYTRPSELHGASIGAARWRDSLSQGLLPSAAALEWPPEPLQSEWLHVLDKLQVPRFSRRHPVLLDTTMLNLIHTLAIFKRETAAPPSASTDPDTLDANGVDTSHIESDATACGEEVEGERREAAASLAMEHFIDAWQPEAEAADAAGDLVSQLGGERATGTPPEGGWKELIDDSGWQEVMAMHRTLRSKPDLRRIIRSLGRGGVSGPKGTMRKMRPRSSRFSSRGIVRSQMPPMDAGGLAFTSELSRCLPHQLGLLSETMPPPLPMLGALRFAEGSLHCRELSGWQPLGAYGTRHTESRPLRDAGPLLICLDGSGSMDGPHGLLARAALLEALRQAQRARRGVFVAAFGGEGELHLLKLAIRAPLLAQLGTFLTHSFGGGTSLEAPLKLCLEKLVESEWAESDLLLITDGEVEAPSAELAGLLEEARARLGLRIHGLVVQRYRRTDETLDEIGALCDQLHTMAARNG